MNQENLSLTKGKMKNYEKEKCIKRALAELPDNKENYPHKEYIKVKGEDWGCFACKGYNNKCPEYEIQKIKPKKSFRFLGPKN